MNNRIVHFDKFTYVNRAVSDLLLGKVGFELVGDDFKTLESLVDDVLILKVHGRQVDIVENALKSVGDRQEIVKKFCGDDNG